MRIRFHFTALLLFGCVAPSVHATPPQEMPVEGLDVLYGDEEFVSIATGTRQRISHAPAVATVITADDIHEMAAEDLDEVLGTVPGLHVSYTRKLYSPLYYFRGIASEYNPQILMLVNGIPVTNLFQGDRNMVWGGMPVENIARVEVVRGPGSALYGADAFAGVINVITKTSEEINGTEAGVRVGSFNTARGWVQHATRFAGVDVAFSAQVLDTDGFDEVVDQDGAAAAVTRAPGSVSVGRQGLDLNLDLHSGDWRLRGSYVGRYEVGAGVGVNDVLDPSGRAESERVGADLSYDWRGLGDAWNVTFLGSVFHTTQRVPDSFVLVPPATLGAPEVSERHRRIGVTATYDGIAGHRISSGAGYVYSELYRVHEFDRPPFVKAGQRENYYLFAQDEWRLIPDWELTAGVRADHYSDFGNTVNPRLALVWDTSLALTTKFLYGRAFRAPSFAELYTTNNAVQVGNPDLEPETIDTFEVAFDYRPVSSWRGGASLYRYKMADVIEFVGSPATSRNIGKQEGYGLELEGEWWPSRSLSMLANYAYQKSTDESNDRDVGYAPTHEAYFRGQWTFAPTWSVVGELDWVAGRHRTATDTRSEVDDYARLDLSVRKTLAAKGLELGLFVKNLGDADAREPSYSTRITNDLPLAGRSLAVEVRAQF